MLAVTDSTEEEEHTAVAVNQNEFKDNVVECIQHMYAGSDSLSVEHSTPKSLRLETAEHDMAKSDLQRESLHTPTGDLDTSNEYYGPALPPSSTSSNIYKVEGTHSQGKTVLHGPSLPPVTEDKGRFATTCYDASASGS